MADTPSGKQKQAQPSKYPWDEIEARYVSDPTLSQSGLAKEYGMSNRRIWEWARDHGWQDKRQKAIDKTAEDLRKIRAAKLANMAHNGLSELVEDSRKIRKLIFDRMTEDLGPDGAPRTEEDSLTKTTHDKKTGETTKKTVKRRRMMADSKIAATLLRLETDALIALTTGDLQAEGSDGFSAEDQARKLRAALNKIEGSVPSEPEADLDDQEGPPDAELPEEEAGS